MGYYTSHTIMVTDKDGFDITPEMSCAIARALCEFSTEFDMDEFERLDNESEDMLGDLIMDDVRKWSEYEDEVTKLSTLFPELYFEIEGHGEDWSDIWKFYAHNGDTYFAPAEITFGCPDWMIIKGDKTMVEFDDFDTQRQCEEEYAEAPQMDVAPTQKYTYFEFPTQLKWWDIDNECYVCGIGYRNEIICGCCGCFIDIEALYDDVPEGIEAIIPYDSWIDISEELKGEN